MAVDANKGRLKTRGNQFSSVEKVRRLEEDEKNAVVHGHNLAIERDWVVFGEACVLQRVMRKAFLCERSGEMFKSTLTQCTLPDYSNLGRGDCSRLISALYVLDHQPLFIF